MHLDDALELVGEFGTYQKTRLLLLCAFSVVSAWHALNMVFVGAETDFHCSTDDVNASRYRLNQSDVEELLTAGPDVDSCERYVADDLLPHYLKGSENFTKIGAGKEKCPAGYVFSKEQYDATITSTFDLVCERNFLRTTCKSVYFAGRMVGAVIFGQLSDRFGRRPLFFVGVALLVLAGGVASVAPHIAVFIPMYFLQGAAQTGAFLVSYILSTELVGPNYRVEAGFLIQTFYSLGIMSLAGIAYFIRDWRYLEIAITAPALLFVIYWWLLPESIRWLLSHTKVKEAEAVLVKVAHANGHQQVPPSLAQDIQEDPAAQEDRTYTFLDCVGTWPMARLSLNVWFLWMVNALVYYGLSLNTENLAGSPYLNFCIVGAVEIPADIMCILLLNRVGRRSLLIVSMYLGGVACIVSGVLPKNSDAMVTLTVVFAMVGKFGITASYGTIYLCAAEIFPTVVRNIGMGVSSMSARFGGILAPIILESSHVLDELPMFVFGSLSVVGATLAFLLPETSGRSLPQILEDVDSGRSCGEAFLCCTTTVHPEASQPAASDSKEHPPKPRRSRVCSIQNYELLEATPSKHAALWTASLVSVHQAL